MECHLKMIVPLILTLITGLIVQTYFPVDSLLIFIIKALGLGGIYFVLMWFISLNNFEKKLFLGVFKKIKTRI